MLFISSSYNFKLDYVCMLLNGIVCMLLSDREVINGIGNIRDNITFNALWN